MLFKAAQLLFKFVQPRNFLFHKSMLESKVDTLLAHCLQLIEAQLGWGSPKTWTTQDFERLGEEIAKRTSVALSVTTLKRLWGRVKYQSAPTVTTLNALAMFLGHANWREFEQSFSHPPVASSVEEAVRIEPDTVTPQAAPVVAQTAQPAKFSYWRGGVLALLLIVGLFAVLIFFQNHASPKPLNPAAFSFSSAPVTKGIPNSVVFHYDASASPTDSVFIQQSWDPARREAVPKKGKVHSSIYYYPGYYKAKLVIGKQVVREHDLVIASEGWVVAAMQEPVPVYFKTNNFLREGVLHLPLSTLQQQQIPLQPRPPMVSYSNVFASPTGLKNSDFDFTTRVKSDYAEGSAACQNIVLAVLCRDDFLAFPLSAKGCVGKLGLFLAGHSASSKDTDLSAFGCQVNEWVEVQCQVRNKQVRLFVNGKKAYEAVFPHAPAEIIGIGYQFEGTGSVDFTRLSRPNGTVVYEDNFNVPAGI